MLILQEITVTVLNHNNNQQTDSRYQEFLLPPNSFYRDSTIQTLHIALAVVGIITVNSSQHIVIVTISETGTESDS